MFLNLSFKLYRKFDPNNIEFSCKEMTKLFDAVDSKLMFQNPFLNRSKRHWIIFQERMNQKTIEKVQKKILD